MRRLGFILAVAVAAGGCSGPDSDPGLDLLLRVGGDQTQFYRGTPPAESGGPMLLQLNSSSAVRPGQNDGAVAGLAAPETTAVILYLDNDRGYWVFPPSVPDPSANFALTYNAPIRFSSLIPNGTYTMVGRAVDLQGRVGPALNYKVRVADTSTSTMPSTLLISLRWDVEADLDLHLLLPDGSEVFSQKINSYQPQNGDMPDAYLKGGILDADSNATCIIDGRRTENIYWTQTPPSGHYIARVETYSMCGETAAIWDLGVTQMDQQLGLVHGMSRDSDTLPKRGRDAGLTAFEFDIP
jgi:hypothetical protein